MDEVVERDAKLFEAGIYEDKGIEVTEDDLDRIIECHQPVPIKVEHTDSPLVLGTLVKVWRVGKELLGRLAFTKPAWELVKASGARKLSVALKRDRSGLAEVSLVRNPRVADAAVFAGAEVVCFMNEFEKGDEGMEFDEKIAEKDKRIEELEMELRTKDVEVKIDELKRAGKLVPAAEKFARSILAAPDAHTVTFDEGEKPVSELFLEFLKAQPKVVEFSELAEASVDESADLVPEARALYEKLGLTPEAVAKYRTR
jgi:hypothetical protein